MQLSFKSGATAKVVSRICSAQRVKPPNLQRIIAINEGKTELDGIDPLDLEAGPNRCAVR
jgi:hypothetical protein